MSDSRTPDPYPVLDRPATTDRQNGPLPIEDGVPTPEVFDGWAPWQTDTLAPGNGHAAGQETDRDDAATITAIRARSPLSEAEALDLARAALRYARRKQG
jgi:hypothetical protein